MRTFKVLKDYLSVLCSCFCIRESLFQRTNNNDMQNSSHCIKAVEVCTNGQTMDRGMISNSSSNGLVSRKSTDLCAADNKDEALPLRSQSGDSHGVLDLKHSACLFCLGNHPKRVVISSLTESKSVEELKHLCDEKRTSVIIENKIPELRKLSENRKPTSMEDIEASESIFPDEKSTLLLLPHPKNNNRRGSMHLSLENLKSDDSCPCLHHLEEQATRS